MGRSRTIELLRDVDDLPADDRQFVAALERGLRVLRMFSSAHETLSNGELARGTALSKATISRLTYTLSRLGYLTHDSSSGRYRLGPGALALGYASLSKFDVRQVARPLMQNLADYAGASFAQWLIEERLALPSTAANEWTAGVAMLRFDAAIFVRL